MRFMSPVQPMLDLPTVPFRVYCALCALRDNGYPTNISNVQKVLGYNNRRYVNRIFRYLDNAGWADFQPYVGAMPRDSKKEEGNRWDTSPWHWPMPDGIPSPNTPSQVS
jgi:hypothetical protein